MRRVAAVILALAVLLLPAAAARVTSADLPEGPCAEAEALLALGRLDAVPATIANVTDPCAAVVRAAVQGQRDHAKQICAAADASITSGRRDDAAALYGAALGIDDAAACALEGLGNLAPPSGEPTPMPTPDYCAAAQPLVDQGRLAAAEAVLASSTAPCATSIGGAIAQRKVAAATLCTRGEQLLAHDRLVNATVRERAKSAYEDAVKLNDDAPCAVAGFAALQRSDFLASLVSTIGTISTAVAIGVFIALAFAAYRRRERRRLTGNSYVSVTAAMDGYPGEVDKGALQRLTTQVRGALENLNLRPPTPSLGATASAAAVKVVEALPSKEVAGLAGAIAGLLNVAASVRTASAVTLSPIDRAAATPPTGVAADVEPEPGPLDVLQVIAGALGSASQTLQGADEGGAPVPRQAGVAVEIRGPDESLVAMDAVWDDKESARIDRIAALVYRRVVQGPETPAWRRWTDPTGTSMLAVLQGLEVAGRLDSTDDEKDAADAAIAMLSAAVADEPQNVAIRQTLGQLQERRGRRLDALETALGLVTRWPNLVAPRYRLGVLYSFIDEWWPQYAGADAPRRAGVDALMRLVEGTAATLPTDGLPAGLVVPNPQRAARAQAYALGRRHFQLCIDGLRSKDARSEFDAEAGAVGGSPTAPRAAAELVVQSADLSVRLLELSLPPLPDPSVPPAPDPPVPPLPGPAVPPPPNPAVLQAIMNDMLVVARDPRSNFQVQYNVASCFGNLMSIQGASIGDAVRSALDSLTRAMEQATYDQRRQLAAYMPIDPDLDALRLRPEYRTWRSSWGLPAP